jgi:putative ABC transport system permease protein
LNGERRTIIGVMPPRFEWHVGDLWIPGALDRNDDPRASRGARWFQARLRHGVSVEEATAQLAVIGARRAAERPQDYPPGSYIQVITLVDWVVGRFRTVLYTLFGAVALLLVIACCNVANMLLARATVREQEMSVRAALGASRARIMRQLLAESGTLALGGAVAGCLLAFGGIALLARFLPRQGVAWEVQLRLDQPVLYFALATAALATIAFGLFPALYSARRDLVVGANRISRGGTAARQHRRMRGALVVAEVALSIILLVGSGPRSIESRKFRASDRPPSRCRGLAAWAVQSRSLARPRLRRSRSTSSSAVKVTSPRPAYRSLSGVLSRGPMSTPRARWRL